MIPKIFHQSSKYFTWEECKLAQRARAMMPDWQYRAWKDEDNLALVRQIRSADVEEYIKFPNGAIRSDVARYLYMYKYGGVYFDTDFRFCRPISEQLLSHLCILGIEDEDFPDFGGGPKLGNAFIASQPGLPMWMELVDGIFATFRENERDPYAWQLSGPYALTTFIRSHKEYEAMITVLSREVLYPKLIRFNLTGARRPETIGVHLCWSSWREMSLAHKFKNRVRRIMSALA